MAKKAVRYRGHLIEPNSYQLRAGGWVPRAWVIADDPDSLTMRPVWSKSKTSQTLREADAIAIQLGKLWVDRDG